MIDVPLLKHQLEFCLDADTRYLALVGGYGCGKTFSFCVKTVLIASLNVGHRGVIMEPTNSMVKRTLLPEMDRTLEMMGVPYTYKASDVTYILHFEDGDTEVMCLSGENYKRLAGLNLAFFGVDECDTINKEIARSMWNMAMSRLRRGSVYQGYTTSTPEGFNFLYEFFEAEPREKDKQDRKLIKGKTRDNPYVPDEYIDSLMENYPPNLIKSYLEGEFTNLTSGTVYYAFDRSINTHTKTLEDFPKNYPVHIGLDFNVGKMAAVIHVIDGNQVLAVDEISNGKNTEGVIQTIKQRLPGRRITIYPDASGNNQKTSAAMSDIAMLKAAGFEVRYPSKNPPVRDRINSMNAMFCNAKGQRRYFINSKTCPAYTRALEQQVYDKSGAPDKAHDVDHPNDAAGYFIHNVFPITGHPTMRIS